MESSYQKAYKIFKFIDENVFLRKAIELFGTDVEKKDPMKNVKLGEMKKVNSDGTIEK